MDFVNKQITIEFIKNKTVLKGRKKTKEKEEMLMKVKTKNT